MKVKSLQVLLVAVIVALSVAMYVAPSQVNVRSANKAELSKEKPMAGMGQELNAEALLETAKQALAKEEADQLAHLELGLKQPGGSKDTAVLDQLGRFWERNAIPAASAIWFERKAVVLQTERGYLDAAYRYFDSFKMAQDSGLRQLLVQKAIRNYEQVLELNPGNLNAKTDLGACFVEGTGEPMKGIMMLREVVQADPNHEMAQYNLGMLSVRSGQLDKAIERFNKVLSINPKRSEVHVYLGQVYQQKGENDKALEHYRIFMKESEDLAAVTEVGKMVQALEKGAN